jgi:thioredoxin 1
MYKNLHLLALAFLMSGCGAAPRKVEVIEEEMVVQAPAQRAKAGNNFIELENEAQFNEAIASGKFVVVDFFAEWCGPCKQFGPTFKKVSSEFPDIIFIKVDVDKFKSLSEKYNIRGVPTVMVFAQGNAAKPIKTLTNNERADFRKAVQALGA